MTKIAITALKADETPYGNVLVTARLVDAGAGGALPAGLVVAPATVKLNGDGEAIIDLTPNGDYDPVNTYYAITVGQTSPTIVRYIEVPEPNGSGDAEIPYDWADEEIQRLTAVPPTSIPSPSSGTAGQVLTVTDTGNGKRYELEDAAGGLPAGTRPIIDTGLLAAAADYSGGSYTHVVSAVDGQSIPRAAIAGMPLLCVSGASKGLWTNTASGPATPGATVTFGAIYSNLYGGDRSYALALTEDGTTVSGYSVLATLDVLAEAVEDLTASIAVLEAAALEAAPKPVTDGLFGVDQYAQINKAFVGDGVGHFDGAFTTAHLPGVFVTGMDLRWTVCPVAPLDATSENGRAFAEIFTQTHDGPDGAWDNMELAVLWIDGIPVPYFEWTETGGTSEVESPQGDGFFVPVGTHSIPVGQWSSWRTTLEFDVDGQWRGRHWFEVVRAEDADDSTSDGIHWKIASTTMGTSGPTDFDPAVTSDWAIGAGYGSTLLSGIKGFDGLDGDPVFEFRADAATGADTVPDGVVSQDWVAGAQAFITSGPVPLGGASVPTSRQVAGSALSADISAATLKAALAVPIPRDPITGHGIGNGYGYFIPGGIVGGYSAVSPSSNRNRNEVWVFDEDMTIIPAIELAVAAAAGKQLRLWVCSVTAGTWQPSSVYHDFGTVAVDGALNTAVEWSSHLFARGAYLARWVTDGSPTLKGATVTTPATAVVAGYAGTSASILGPASEGASSSGSVSATNTTAFVAAASTSFTHAIKVRRV